MKKISLARRKAYPHDGVYAPQKPWLAHCLGGFTMLEILIATIISVGLFWAIYDVISRASETRALATAKGVAKDQAEIVLRQMERDIASSLATFTSSGGVKKYVPTFDIPSAGKCKMQVPGEGPPSAAAVNVEYLWDTTTKTLTRKNDGPKAKTRVVSDKVENLVFNTQSDAVIQIEVETAVIPEGRTTAQKHNQQFLVTIHSLLNASSTDHWQGQDRVISNY